MDINDFSLEEVGKLSQITDDPVVILPKALNKNKKNLDRYATGFSLFDGEVMNGGFKEGDLVIISGISGEGKTTMAQTLTYNLCKVGIPCLWFSYEVSLEHLDNKFQQMGISNFYSIFVPKKNTTGKLDWIKYKIKEGWVKYATKIVFIDHLDFLTPNDTKTSDNEAVALKKIATELKQMAIELGITIICMAHLKKLPEGKEPDMQDIGYSAGIFQLADYVWIIWREKLSTRKAFSSSDNSGSVYTNNSIVKIVKNRETGINKFLKLVYGNGKFTEPINREPDDRPVPYYENY